MKNWALLATNFQTLSNEMKVHNSELNPIPLTEHSSTHGSPSTSSKTKKSATINAIDIATLSQLKDQVKTCVKLEQANMNTLG